MMTPRPLKKGDKIALAAPARLITQNELDFGIQLLEKQGLKVVYDENLFLTDNQFAGTDQQRAALLQQYLDDPSVAAILFARGGYGSVRIIDLLDFGHFAQHPCWLAGYSDMTVFHNHVNQVLGIETLHAPMPLGFKENTDESLRSLLDALGGNPSNLSWHGAHLQRSGTTKGRLVGGNLSVLYSLLGSRSFPETSGCILFLEDLDEYLYHIDRMMMGLKRAGKLDKLAGLVIGGMTDMRDNSIPFEKTAEEIIWDAVKDYDFPVAMGCPVGHIPDNRTLVMGREMTLEASDSATTICQ